MIVRPVGPFHESETVLVKWALRDGGFAYSEVTIPPRAVREAQQAEQQRRRDASFEAASCTNTTQA